MSKIVKLRPYLKNAVWGTESWVVSSHENGESTVDDAALSSFFRLNYLIKFIDTHKNLSIQVHPNDENAKNESWFILDHKEGAGIYLGFKKGVTKKEFSNALVAGAKIDQFLNFIPVKKGDYFFIPAGTVHAIGADVKLAEIQQSSDTTYRVWDWNRMGLDGKPRELHIDKALEVLNFKNVNQVHIDTNEFKDQLTKLYKFNGIEIEMLQLNSDKELEFKLAKESSLTLIDGAISVDGEDLQAEQSMIAVEDGTFTIKANKDSRVLITRS